MKYPKPWDAGSPAGKPFVASSSNGPHAGQIQIGTYVNRPGTPDHTRLVRTWLTIEDAQRMVAELNHHIELTYERDIRESFARIRRNTDKCGVYLRGIPGVCDLPVGHAGDHHLVSEFLTNGNRG